MLENAYFARLKALFFEKGISFRQSDHLIEELQDHLTLKIAEFQEQGNNPVDSERLAMELLGTPEDIAEKAAADLHRGWMMRYAWLLCGSGFALASLLTMPIIMVLGYYFAGGFGYDSGTSPISLPILQVEVLLFNWLPLLMGMAGLSLLIRFSSVGWKSIFFTAVVTGIVVSAEEIRFVIRTVVNSTKQSFLETDDSFILQWLRLGSGRFLDHEPIFLTIFRLFAPLGMCLLARFASSRAKSNLVVKSDTR